VPIISTIPHTNGDILRNSDFYRNEGLNFDTNVYELTRENINYSIVNFARKHSYPLRIVYGENKYTNESDTRLLPVRATQDYTQRDNKEMFTDGIHLTREPGQEPWVSLNSYTAEIIEKIQNVDCGIPLPSNQAPYEVGIPVDIVRRSDDLNELNFSPIIAQNNRENLPDRIRESGNYEFTSNGETVTSREIILNENQTARIIYFEDLNANNVRDEGESLLDTSDLNLEVSKNQDIKKYELSPGWNPVHFPFILDNSQATAEDLLNAIKSETDSVISIADFDSGQFRIYSLRETITLDNATYGENFNLEPGSGYFIFNNSNLSTEFNIRGNSVEPNADSELSNLYDFESGWNLVGVFDSSNSESFLNNYPGDIISKYDSGNYQSQLVDDNIIYGNKFNLNKYESYFVRLPN
jgi:hypothetical protein